MQVSKKSHITHTATICKVPMRSLADFIPNFLCHSIWENQQEINKFLFNKTIDAFQKKSFRNIYKEGSNEETDFNPDVPGDKLILRFNGIVFCFHELFIKEYCCFFCKAQV